MATDDRATGDPQQKRRGKAPVITLEATELAAATVPAEASVNAAETNEQVADPVIAPVDAIEQQAVSGATSAETTEGASDKAPPMQAEAEAAAADGPISAEAAAPDAPSEAPAHSEAAAPTAPVQSMPRDHGTDRAQPREEAPAGFGRLVAAGLIGALLTGGLAAGAQMAGFIPGANPSVGPDVQTRLAALDQAVKEVAARPLPSAGTAPAAAPDLAPLRRQVETSLAALEQRVKSLEDRPASVSSPGSTPTPPTSATGTPTVDLGPLNREIDALKTAVAALSAPRPSDASVDLGPLNRDIETLKTAVAALNAPKPSEPPAPTIDPAQVDQRIRTALQPEADRIGGLDGRLQAAAADLKTLGDSVQTLGSRIASLEAARGQSDAQGQRAALVVGLQLLRAAVDRGLPYGAELSAAKGLGGDAATLQPLEAGAATGLVTRAALASRFTVLAPAIQRAGTPAPEGGLIDRLSASAQSLVRVRPIGETAGDDVGSVLGRIEAKLARGDLTGALADVDKLPAAAKALTSEWAASAKARLAADTALQGSTTQALSALGTR